MKQVFCYYLFHPWIVFLVGRMNEMVALLILRNVCHHPNIYQGFSTNIDNMDIYFIFLLLRNDELQYMYYVDILLCINYKVLTPGLIWTAATSPFWPGTSCCQSGASSCPCPWGECQCVRWWRCQLTAGLTAGQIRAVCCVHLTSPPHHLTSLLACH